MNKLLLALPASVVLLFSAPTYSEAMPDVPMVDINSASVQELDEQLVGVGRRIAEEIVRHRDTYGPFQSMEDLDKVKFVGNRILEGNKDNISFE